MSTELISTEITLREHQALSHQITSPETLKEAVILLSNINKLADKAKEAKEKMTRPLLNALAVERARWKPLEDSCAKASALLKAKIVDYDNAQQAANAKKESQVLARVEKGTMRVDTAAGKLAELPETGVSVSTDAGAIQYRIVKKLVVTDLAAVPREYLMVDEVRVKEALKKGSVIPGCVLQDEKIIANIR